MKRRQLLQSGAVVLLLGAQHLARGATIVAVRLWPAPDYSRITIESDTLLAFSQTFVPNPPRLAVDVRGIDLNPALKELVAKVGANDPTIHGIRVGQFGAGFGGEKWGKWWRKGMTWGGPRPHARGKRQTRGEGRRRGRLGWPWQLPARAGGWG